ALVLPLLRTLRLTQTTTWLLAAAAGIVPLAVADVVRFELDRYLGDAFDFALMFDLTGRSPAEFVAVGWSHLWLPLLMALAAAAIVTGLLLYRWRTRPAGPPATAAWMTPGWMLPIAVFAAAAVTASGVRVMSP